MKKRILPFFQTNKWFFLLLGLVVLLTACVLVILNIGCIDDNARSLLAEFLGTFTAIYVAFLIFLLTKEQSKEVVKESKAHHEEQIMNSIHAQMAISERSITVQQEMQNQLTKAIMLASENQIKALEEQIQRIQYEDHTDLRFVLFEHELNESVHRLERNLREALIEYQNLQGFQLFRFISTKRQQLKYQQGEIDYFRTELKRLKTAKNKIANDLKK